MRTMLTAAVVLIATACSGPADGVAGDDAAATCEVTDERGRSCSRVCTAFTPAELSASQLCGSEATWDRCVDECVRGRSVSAWCP